MAIRFADPNKPVWDKNFGERFLDLVYGDPKIISPIPGKDRPQRNFGQRFEDLFFPGYREEKGGMDASEAVPTQTPKMETPTPLATPTPRVAGAVTPTPIPQIVNEDNFKSGFDKYGSKLATASASFAREANTYKLPDPYLPAVLSLMETSGGKNQRFKNNPFNWGMQDMPSLDHAINRIYSGIAERYPQYYQEYLDSGDLRDLFKRYTPSNDPNNPEVDVLIDRYKKLRKNFPD